MTHDANLLASPMQIAPLWKRVLAGVLDFLLAYAVIGWLLMLTVGSHPFQSRNGFTLSLSASGFGFSLEGWPVLLLFTLICAYFVVTKRFGGRVFRKVLSIENAQPNG